VLGAVRRLEYRRTAGGSCQRVAVVKSSRLNSNSHMVSHTPGLRSEAQRTIMSANEFCPKIGAVSGHNSGGAITISWPKFCGCHYLRRADDARVCGILAIFVIVWRAGYAVVFQAGACRNDTESAINLSKIDRSALRGRGNAVPLATPSRIVRRRRLPFIIH